MGEIGALTQLGETHKDYTHIMQACKATRSRRIIAIMVSLSFAQRSADKLANDIIGPNLIIQNQTYEFTLVYMSFLALFSPPLSRCSMCVEPAAEAEKEHM